MTISNPNVPSAPVTPINLKPTYSLSTVAVHGDDTLASATDVAPALHVSTTFRYPSDPSRLIPESEATTQRSPEGPVQGDTHVYSRHTAPNSSRLELSLSRVVGGPVLTYSSGLAAFYSLMVYLNPKVVAIGAGYHGCHGVLNLIKKLTGCKIVDLFDEGAWEGLGKGDVVHLETPVNPTGEAYDLSHFANLAHKRGAYLTVDATFGPPPLQNPFKHGADFVMHSGTKYFGGHSDLLCGVIAISKLREGWEQHFWHMLQERECLGNVMGNLEAWLGVRSVRTLDLRVKKQSETATRLVGFIASALGVSTEGEKPSEEDAAIIKSTVAKVMHASLQVQDNPWLKDQMPNGFGPVFAFHLKTLSYAKELPSNLELFHHATSLGGVESLIEWRAMSDNTVEKTLCRVSVGIEEFEDLKHDLLNGLKKLLGK
ncbi:cystathionine gamma-synthase [Piedraia hortae CBS 480.64]|uniref:Cystathionine gamma-synthase n=1 Tax=Piedraia hortae CBS 480.64 TaxID=1314780 RepID=A0A6A7BW94_9PEZI|nr:cystathionine gamma-synthase [Piedraia hortae CBS 480.64]